LLETHADWQVCGEAENGAEAVAKAAVLKPDLVVLDLAMPVVDGLRAAQEISTASPTTPIVMHTLHNSSALELEAKKVGIRTIVDKTAAGDQLLREIEAILNTRPASTVTEVLNGKAQTAGQRAPSGSASGKACDAPGCGDLGNSQAKSN
jgi:DNA-binding NarL/FixJ family response regulator